MSHLHLVDGLLPTAWWIIGYILTLGMLGFALSRVKKEADAKKVPYIGVVAALMLLTMSVPLGFLPFHLNLTVLAGILAGPWLGFIAVFIVNIILALIGHGGITAVGVNTLIIGTEVIIGSYLFRYLKNKIKPKIAVAVTVVVSLVFSTTLMIGVVVASDVGLVHALPDSHEKETVISEKHDQGSSEQKSHDEEINKEDEEGIHEAEDHHYESLKEALAEVQLFKITGLSAVLFILILGIAIEALVTTLVISYFLKVRPDLIQDS